MQLGDPYLLRRDVLESALCGTVAVLKQWNSKMQDYPALGPLQSSELGFVVGWSFTHNLLTPSL